MRQIRDIDGERASFQWAEATIRQCWRGSSTKSTGTQGEGGDMLWVFHPSPLRASFFGYGSRYVTS
jgi:hypothetical protein